MTRYLSHHIPGFSEIVKEALHNRFSDVKIIEQYEDMIVYDTAAPIGKVNHNPIFENTFMVIRSFEDTSVNDLFLELTQIQMDKGITKTANIHSGESFRVYLSQEGHAAPVNHVLLAKIERTLAEQLNLNLSRDKAYWEFWIITRSDRKAYFCLRLTYHPSYDKQVREGKLRPDLAGLLCYVSVPQKSDIFLDPFCGYGAIPIARTQAGKYSKIYGMDADPDVISELKENTELERVQFEVTDITKGSPFGDQSISKIVTDPAWGHYGKTETNIDRLIEASLKECRRVLTKDGILVMIIAEDSQAPKLFESSGFSVAKTFDVLISGKMSTVYKLVLKA